MCGIIGYIGDKNIVDVLIEGLKKLEYRGYDSAGICLVNKNKLNVAKKEGRISELELGEEIRNIHGNLGIAHTRWATHGEPNEINAHPHLDCKNEVAIVHNGIIENHNSLRSLLKKEGHKIKSETDSEIFAHLIEKFYFGNLEKAVSEALAIVEGAFGLAVLHKNENKIVIARRGSPLIIGVGDGEMFVTSDATGILNHTKKVVYLNDNEIASLDKNGFFALDFKGNNVNKEIYEIKWEVEQMEKSGFKHFMLKEVFEQPETIKNLLRGRVKNNRIKLSLNLNLDLVKRIVIVACGTSWHSGLIGKYIIEEITGIPVEVDYASEFRYRNPILNENDLVIVISQSGETADTLSALKEAKSKNAKTMGIINVVGSTISREVDTGIYLHAGPEIGVASTKAFTSQIMALLLFALFIKQEKFKKIDIELVEQIINLPDKIDEILKISDEIKLIAEKFKDSRNFLYLGRGINFPVALEGALKLKEISYIHAEGYPAAEMKHGPIALIDENMPVVFLAPKDSTYEKILSNIQEVKARKGRIIIISNEDDEKLRQLSENMIIIPKTRSEISPVLNVLPLQLLAYYIADMKGLDVDKPRN
ncbi:MAG: glutamine--fructose-6-phosphate transaminase (isomerizing), partial [archaeon]